MKNMLAKLLRKQEGQGMVEYVLIIAGIAAIIIAAIALFGGTLKNMIGNIFG